MSRKSQAWYILQCLAYYCHSITLINQWHFAFVLMSFYLTDRQNSGDMKPVQKFHSDTNHTGMDILGN